MQRTTIIMNKFKYALMTALLIGALPLMAQDKSQRVNSSGGKSPHETTGAIVDGNRVTVTYGRPSMKGREIWGKLVPYGKVWRTGSDEATILITQKPIVIGGTTVPAGAYTLFTLPNEDGSAKLIINKQIGQWGIGPGSYDEAQDLARVDLKKDTLDTPVEEFTIAVTRDGQIKLSWDKTQVLSLVHRPEVILTPRSVPPAPLIPSPLPEGEGRVRACGLNHDHLSPSICLWSADF